MAYALLKEVAPVEIPGGFTVEMYITVGNYYPDATTMSGELKWYDEPEVPYGYYDVVLTTVVTDTVNEITHAKTHRKLTDLNGMLD
jgi:hypothetical protein